MTKIDGFYNRNLVIQDSPGKTDHQVGGARNNVTFQGDDGANTFHVGGQQNDVQIKNLGKDDNVILEGNEADWNFFNDDKEGSVSGINLKSGNSIQVETDDERNDEFVMSRIQFKGGPAGEEFEKVEGGDQFKDKPLNKELPKDGVNPKEAVQDTFVGNCEGGQSMEGSSTKVDGIGRKVHIKDTAGETNQEVKGAFNDVTYTGDEGKNTFRVGGAYNNVKIENLGQDDTVNLEGKAEDWFFDSGSGADGSVTGFNKVTGNSIQVATDDKRDDAFVKDRMKFSGDYSSESPFQDMSSVFGGWGNMGNLALCSLLFGGLMGGGSFFDVGRIFGPPSSAW